MRALALTLAVLVGCDAGQKPPPPEAVKPIAKPTPAVAPASTAFALDYLPADADMVMHLDLAALRRWKQWAAYEKDLSPRLLRDFPSCAHDLLTDVSSATMAYTLGSELGVYVIRGLDRDRTLRCLRETKSTQISFDGELVTVTHSGGASVMKFVDPTTLVIQGPKQPTKQTLTAVIDAGAPLAKDAALPALIETARKRGVAHPAFTLASRPGSTRFAAKMATVGFKPQQLYMTAQLTDRFDLRLTFALATSDEAFQLSNMVKGQAANPQVKQYFDRFEVVAQAETTTIDVGMTAAQLSSMFNLFRGMWGPT